MALYEIHPGSQRCPRDGYVKHCGRDCETCPGRFRSPPDTGSPRPGHDGFDSVMSVIGERFRPAYTRDEESLEMMLEVFLNERCPDRRCERQVDNGHGKIDMVIDGRYGIELKLAEGKGVLRDLIGQARLYRREYERVGLVLYADHDLIRMSDMAEFLEEYKRDNVDYLIIWGKIRRRDRT